MTSQPLPRHSFRRTSAVSLLAMFLASSVCAATIDLARFDPRSGARVTRDASTLRIEWPVGTSEKGAAEFNLTGAGPLIRSFGLSASDSAAPRPVVRNLTPATILTVGSRNLDPRHGWIKFFDKVHTRPHESFRVALELQEAKVISEGSRTLVVLDRVHAGSFSGELRFTFYHRDPLIKMETVLSTGEDARAILYDTGFEAGNDSWTHTAWMDNQDAFHKVAVRAQPARPLAVRYRTLLAESETGTLAVFPPPHQFFYPLDFANNFQFAWHGRNYRQHIPGPGLGVRQPLDGDRRFVPWFNAPPGTKQAMGVFLLLSRSDARPTLEEVKRYTRDDRFDPLPGHRTFTSHYHIEHTLDLLNRRKESGTEGIPPELRNPGFKRTFKRMGVDIVHLAEFHNGRTPRLEAPERLRQLATMHAECARLSEPDFLLLPGEEPNVHLGGHWISFFPKPVYWVLNRDASRPFVESHPRFGRVYHVGSAEDVRKLFQIENGLNWTAHARIKSSTGYPDAYRDQEFYRQPTFLGAAWKAMPADLSQDKLGLRVLDLLDDMANWGQRKYVLGEVDVFQVQPDYELYGHMNINYLKLDRIPRFKDGWEPVLDCLREGRYFTTTGEILIPEFKIGGKESGQTLDLPASGSVQLKARAEFTFPLEFAEIISGDGKQVFRDRIPLNNGDSFGEIDIEREVHLKGRKWVRLEVWDTAANGAFTPPVWIE